MNLADYYLWIKAIHIIVVIAWMAGMLYLPRLFVYHSKVRAGSEASELFKTMEARLLRAIMLPAMVLVWVLGIMLVHVTGYDADVPLWLMLKFALVVILSGIHGLLARYAKAFARDERPRSENFFRAINEIPAVLMVVIVILVVVKPW